jgi:hypothetical protein
MLLSLKELGFSLKADLAIQGAIFAAEFDTKY